jgi:hypothetical protein
MQLELQILLFLSLSFLLGGSEGRDERLPLTATAGHGNGSSGGGGPTGCERKSLELCAALIPKSDDETMGIPSTLQAVEKNCA